MICGIKKLVKARFYIRADICKRDGLVISFFYCFFVNFIQYQIHHLKGTTEWVFFSIFTMSYQYHCHFISITTERSPKPISSPSQFLSLPIPWQTLICFLFPWICLCGASPLNESCSMWPFGTGRRFSELIHIVARINTSLPFTVKDAAPHRIYPFIS